MGQSGGVLSKKEVCVFQRCLLTEVSLNIHALYSIASQTHKHPRYI